MKRYNQENYVDESIKTTLENLRKDLSEAERQMYLLELKKKIKTKNLDRYLIEIFPYTLSEEEQVRLLNLLGRTGGKRASLFLIKTINSSENTTLVREALFSLGLSESLLGLSFLSKKLLEKDYLFLKEVLIALSRKPLFFLQKTLEKLFQDKDLDSSLKMQIILSCGERLPQSAFPFLLEIMKENFEKEPALFNASLLAAGRLGTEKDIKDLLVFKDEKRFFAVELLESTIERIQARSSLSLPSLLEKISQETLHSKNFYHSLLLLRSFQREEVFQAFSAQTLSSQKLEQEAFLHFTFLEEKPHPKTQAFFEKEASRLESITLAYYIQYLTELGENQKIEDFLQRLELEKQLEILSEVTFGGAFSYLIKLFHQKNLSKELRVALINTLIYQSFMGNLTEESQKNLAFLFRESLKKEQESLVAGRFLRALCELSSVEKGDFSFVEKLYQEKKIDLGSYALFLRALNSKEADETLSELFLFVLKRKEKNSIQQILQILIEDKKALPRTLLKMPESLKEDFPILLLKILGEQTLENFEGFIAEKLKSSYLDEVFLSLKAFQNNPFEEAWEQICHLAKKETNSPSQLFALEVLASEGNQKRQEIPLDFILNNKLPREHLLRLLKVFKPSFEGEKNSLEELRKATHEKAHFLEDEELLSSAISLLLRMEASNREPKRKTLSPEETHSLDSQIEKRLACYPSFTKDTKAVLRNAELTWERSDLFDKLVDKSTMIIEYTKALELMIQDKIGGPLCLDPVRLSKTLQQRVFFLGLSDTYISTRKFLEVLNCEDFFSEKTFPRHRAQGLIKSALSGDFASEYSRKMDGIRSWALMFLMFFRDFSSRGKSVKSLIRLTDSSHKTIAHLAQSLNSLQEIRNSAAHRGTLFNLEKISFVREETFLLLEKMDSL